MNLEKLNYALDIFIKNKNENPEHYTENYSERKERVKYYQSFTAEKIRKMTKDDFYEYFAKLWSMIIWGNKRYIADKIVDDNGLEQLQNSLIELLYSSKPIDKRWDEALEKIKDVGPSTISELLSYSNPDDNAIFNKRTVDCLKYLEIENLPVYTYQYTGKKYLEICSLSKEISKAMKAKGLKDTDMLFVDYFLWDDLLPLTNETKQDSKKSDKEIQPAQKIKKETKSIHNEVRDKIVEIGRLLGFESESEVKVASGAVVDAVWKATIGNMGIVIYVFEVQTSGSIDSLILNLIRAKHNPAVQSVVAVSDETQLDKIKKESYNTHLEDLKTWESQDVLKVYDSLSEAYASINKLGLVPSDFSKP